MLQTPTPTIVARIILTLITLWIGNSVLAESGDLKSIEYIDRIGYVPHVFEGEQGLDGIVPSMVAAIFEDTGLDIISSDAPRTRAIREVINGHADITSALVAPPLMLKSDYPDSLVVCDTPLVTEDVMLVTLTKPQHSVPNPKRYRIGWLNSPNRTDILKEIGLGHAIATQYHSNRALVKALISKRIDGAIISLNSALYIVRQLNQETELTYRDFIGKTYMHLVINGEFARQHSYLDICLRVTQLQDSGRLADIYYSFMKAEEQLIP